MNDPQQYAILVQKLDELGYFVEATAQGYLVCDRSDPSDVSSACDLDELADLADLFDWAAQRYRRLASAN